MKPNLFHPIIVRVENVTDFIAILLVGYLLILTGHIFLRIRSHSWTNETLKLTRRLQSPLWNDTLENFTSLLCTFSNKKFESGQTD